MVNVNLGISMTAWSSQIGMEDQIQFFHLIVPFKMGALFELMIGLKKKSNSGCKKVMRAFIKLLKIINKHVRELNLI